MYSDRCQEGIPIDLLRPLSAGHLEELNEVEDSVSFSSWLKSLAGESTCRLLLLYIDFLVHLWFLYKSISVNRSLPDNLC